MVFQESETVELKAIVVDDIKKEIIAFANCVGGTIYIGVQDDGTILGLDDADCVSLQVSNMIRDAIKPDLTMFIHYETLIIDEKKIIKIDVQQGTNRPYYIAKKGLRPEGVYVRQGYSCAPATNTAIRHMIKETDGDHFEEMRSLQQNLTFKSAKKEFIDRNIKFEQSQMKTLGVMTNDGIYTNLGLLLSDQCVHTIKAAVFEGTNQNQFKDRKEFSGSLFQQMHDVYDFIDFCNQTHSSFEKLYRIDRRDYPEVSIRESLLNLLTHRLYSIRASSFISIFSDRIEFTSIGGLVDGISLNDIKMGISICRNEKLAHVFYRLELIEAHGTGIQKIMDAYKETDSMPQIYISENAFKIVLPNLNVNTNKKEENHQDFKKNTEEEQIILLAQKQGFITRKEIEKLLGMSQTTCGRRIKQMVEVGLLIQKGKGKNTHYHLPK